MWAMGCILAELLLRVGKFEQYFVLDPAASCFVVVDVVVVVCCSSG